MSEEKKEETQSSPFVFDMAKFAERQQTELAEAHEAMKDDFVLACVALAEFGVKEVYVEYDGYGDSGSVELVSFLDTATGEGYVPSDWFQEHLVELTEKQDMSVPCKVEFSRKYTSGEGDEPGKWVSEYREEGLKSFFEGAAYKWLPGGWEINSGSKGVISVNVDERSYSIDHGWRVEDVQSESYSFDFSSEEVSS